MSVVETSPAVCCWCRSPLKRIGEGPWWCFTQACLARQREWAVGIGPHPERVDRYLYVPTPKQTEFHETRITPALRELFLAEDRAAGRPPKRRRMARLYGGAAGPGKSHGERWDQYRKALLIPDFTGVILRRTMPELRKTHLRAFQRDARILGAEFNKGEATLTFENGSILECGHCEDDDAIQKWLSTEYDQIGLDEGVTFRPDMLLELSTRARSTKAAVLDAGGPWFDVVTNPGGASWSLLLDLFVTHTPDFEIYPALRESYDPRLWVYIKGLLDDNPYMDASYADALAVLSDARYRQLRYGEEHITEGAFFTWRETKDGQPWHVRTREIVPTEVAWFASMDWGFNAPGVVLWWAILPDGHYHIAHEWKFAGLTADLVADGIHRVNAFLGIPKLRYIACDPSMARRDGQGRGESILETLSRHGLPMRPSDNDRKNGWARCQQLLAADRSGRAPWVTIDEGCRYGRRTMPAQVQDKTDPDDLDTDGDDHWADAFRYGAMSRPAHGLVAEVSDPPFPVNSWGWWRRFHERKSSRRPVLR